MAYTVQPSKGDFLLFTVMNLAGYNDNNRFPRFHPLRERTRAYFSEKINDTNVLEMCRLWRPAEGCERFPYETATTLQEIERGINPSDSEKSKKIREVLEKFRASSGFDEFYPSISPDYERICDEVRGVMSGAPIEQTLEEAWEIKPDFRWFIIPRPLDAPH